MLFVLSIFIFNKSRIASTLMVIYFVASRVIIWTALGSPRGLPIALVFLAIYINAMRGTFRWHKKQYR